LRYGRSDAVIMRRYAFLVNVP